MTCQGHLRRRPDAAPVVIIGAIVACVLLFLMPGATAGVLWNLAAHDMKAAALTKDGEIPRQWSVPAITEADPVADIEILITLDDPTDVLAFYFDLRFDPALLECTGVALGSLCSGCMAFDPNIENPEGRVRWAGLIIDPLSGGGDLVVLQFHVKDGAPNETSPIHFATTDADPDMPTNLNDGAIPLEVTDGLVAIRGTGSLTVTIEPEAARTAGAQWSLDSGPWQNSAAALPAVASGPHTVSFKSLESWATPGDESVRIVTTQESTVTGTYIYQSGALTVAIEPAEARLAGAMWRIDGGAWHASGTTLADMSATDHVVSYSEIAGWAKPGDRSVRIPPDATVPVTDSYTKETGAVHVAIGPPEAVAAGAQWRVDGGPWQASDSTVGDLSMGSHVVAFKEVVGWIAPADQTVQIETGKTAEAEGPYLAAGSLVVMAAPEEVLAAGAQCSIDGGPWLNNGTQVDGLPVGDHVVAFKPVAGWDTPEDQVVPVRAGQVATATGTYVQRVGSLTVTLGPEGALTAGAQWRVDDQPWQASGSILDGISEGLHTLGFNAFPGWTRPVEETVTILTGQVLSLSREYDCVQPYFPENVAASDGTYGDKVHVSWESVEEHNVEYRVFRGLTLTFGDAVPISDWITTEAFDDTTAAAPATGNNTGCAGRGVTEYSYYYYWIQCRRVGGCESLISQPDKGHRGLAEALKQIARALPSTSTARAKGGDDSASGAGGDILILGAAVGLFAAPKRFPRRRSEERGKV